MKNYNEKAYLVSIAHKLFKDEDNKEIPSRSFNFFYFILMYIQDWLNFFGCDCKFNWRSTQTSVACSAEVSNQVDITYIMRKLNFLDAAFEKILEKHEI